MGAAMEYTDSAPLPWYATALLITVIVLAILLVGRHNRTVAKAALIVIAVLVVGSLALQGVISLAFDCTETSDSSGFCRLRM